MGTELEIPSITTSGTSTNFLSTDTDASVWNFKDNGEIVYDSNFLRKTLQGATEIKGGDKNMIKRLVRVFICDPDENISLEKSLIYRGEEKFIDLTDQELFFEIDFKKILADHNEYRKSVINKTVKLETGNDIFLEPINIR